MVPNISRTSSAVESSDSIRCRRAVSVWLTDSSTPSRPVITSAGSGDATHSTTRSAAPPAHLCIAGLIPITSGRVVFDGKEISSLSRRAMRPFRRKCR